MVRFDSVSEGLVKVIIISLIMTKHNDIINKR